ncbi:MAG: hypothetical protein L6Q59_15850 [Ignavibacteriaceae bacterium]|nr:hypothetical protein [Ignavibacteriaceae bacterium]
MGSKFSVFPGQYENQLNEGMQRYKNENVLGRILSHDYTVWSNSPEEITNRLGWLKSPENSLLQAADILEFVSSVKKDGIKNVLLLGMGGSSLAPEVFSLIYGGSGLNLSILDSTDPGAVLEAASKYNPAETLYIVSTKSGGTVETLSFLKYFYNLVVTKLGADKVKVNLAAITDPGSGLEKMTRELGFRKIFLNDPNIGGRFSALSLFGIVPAALTGADIEKLLNRASEFTQTFTPSEKYSLEDDSSSILGLLMGELAGLGVDKVTFLTSPGISSFGWWVEQLVAESTGKRGHGILPVEGEKWMGADNYGFDRLFVNIRLADDHSFEEKVGDLKKAGFPVVEIVWDDVYELGAEFLRWEVATAVAGWRLGIQPFDQPNVEQAKVIAREFLKKYTEEGVNPALNTSLSEDGISILGDEKHTSLKEALSGLFSKVQEGKAGKSLRSYLCLQPFIKPADDTSEALKELRDLIGEKYKIAVTCAYGPRFLHSTGQLHKGDAGNGLFIQFTGSMPEDTPIPDEPGSDKSAMSFGVLKNAQTLGDRMALLDNKRTVLTFDLGISHAASIRKITSIIKSL